MDIEKVTTEFRKQFWELSDDDRRMFMKGVLASMSWVEADGCSYENLKAMSRCINILCGQEHEKAMSNLYDYVDQLKGER